MTISVRHAENGMELWLHFSTDNLERERTLTPAEARALAAELEEAAWQVEQNKAAQKAITALEKLP